MRPFPSKRSDATAVRRKNKQNDSAISATALPSGSSTACTASARIEQPVEIVTPGISDTLRQLANTSLLQDVIDELLAVLQINDRHAQNKAVVGGLRRRLHRLSDHLRTPLSVHDGSERSQRVELISLLQDISDQLKQSVTPTLTELFTELDHYLTEYSFAAERQIDEVTQLRQFGGPAATHLPSVIFTHYCLTLVDGRGNEHQIPLEFCTSFQQFNNMMHVIFWRNTIALIQARYVREGLYTLYIDEGAQVAKRVDPDIWPIFKAGTKIVMKFLEPLCESFEDLSEHLTKTSEDQVGQGSFGDVWKCSLSYTSGITSNLKTVDVAVKVLRPSSDAEDDMKNIRREIGIWKRLRHNHIVPFIGVADAFAPSRISLVSSWQENGTLISLLKRNSGMERKDRLLLLRDIASGLSYLHSVNFVHGDLNGSNVLIDADGCARLTDFGLSSVVDAGEGLSYLALSKMRPGAVRWMAPELCVEDAQLSPTFSSDIYFYGCIMLQTLSGCLPWSEIKRDLLIIIKLSQGCLPQRRGPESLPILDAHWDFIVLCLNSSVASRPPATEVLEWIRAEIRAQEPKKCPLLNASPTRF